LERFRQKVQVLNLVPSRQRRVAAHENDGNVTEGVVSFESLDELESAHAGHHEVEHETDGRIPAAEISSAALPSLARIVRTFFDAQSLGHLGDVRSSSTIMNEFRFASLHALETPAATAPDRGIQHVADVIVGRDFLDPEQGLQFERPWPFSRRAGTPETTRFA